MILKSSKPVIKIVFDEDMRDSFFVTDGVEDAVRNLMRELLLMTHNQSSDPECWTRCFVTMDRHLVGSFEVEFGDEHHEVPEADFFEELPSKLIKVNNE